MYKYYRLFRYQRWLIRTREARWHAMVCWIGIAAMEGLEAPRFENRVMRG